MDLPPGDARLKVTVEVIGTPTHEESQESEIITIQFSNIADEDGESDWLVIVIVVLTGLVLLAVTRLLRRDHLVVSDSNFVPSNWIDWR